ncbi:MAG: IS30 family transposase [Patescibacteria group bacterium]
MAHSQFCKSERNELSILLQKGYSHREIAKSLGKHHSAVDREIKRNSVKKIYDPLKAQTKSKTRRQKTKYQNMKINESPEFVDFLIKQLRTGWSPEQIAGRWNYKHPYDKHFSFKAIYKYLYSAFGQHLCKYLLSKSYYCRKRKGKKQKRLPVKNHISIERRPKVINERKRFGDFEADVLGSPKTDSERLPALVERISRKLFAIKVPRLKYAVDGFKKMLKPYRDILKSITFDNGPENARHLELGCKTYFCHSYSAWEKGQIENTLGRLRRFIKKKSRLSEYSDQDIASFVERMNNTPRKCLEFKTPNEVFEELLVKERKKNRKSRKY